MPDETHPAEQELDREQVELSDLLNRVLDKGVVITGSVLISVADVDLVRLGLSLVLGSVESERERARERPRTIARAAGAIGDTSDHVAPHLPTAATPRTDDDSAQ